MTTLDPHALRHAFGSFMTGVTVVTTKAADGTPLGFTANSFSSVSLDPPLLLVCPGKFLSSYDSFARASRFAVNVLAEGQEEVANTFARCKGDRFAHTTHHGDDHGNILIDGAVAQFSCTTHRVMEAGDHAILVGKIEDFNHDKGRGLGYAAGQFFSLGLERAALEHAGRSALLGAIITRGDDVLLEKTEAGYRPPQVISTERQDVRRTLDNNISSRGQPVTLGPAYAVFDDGNTQCSYFLAQTEAPGTVFARCAIRDIPKVTFATLAITDMMRRFALEAETCNFGLYVGDAQRGDVHHLQERT